MSQASEEILAHIDERTTVLDIGCGYGDLCALIAEQKKPQSVLGIDHDEHKIQTAQMQYADVPNLQFETADLLRLTDIEAQTILIIDVMHYFPTLDQIAILQKLAATSKVEKIIVRDIFRSGHLGYAIGRLREFITARRNKTSAQHKRFTYLTQEEWRRMAVTSHMKINIQKANPSFSADHLIIFTR